MKLAETGTPFDGLRDRKKIPLVEPVETDKKREAEENPSMGWGSNISLVEPVETDKKRETEVNPSMNSGQKNSKIAAYFAHQFSIPNL